MAKIPVRREGQRLPQSSPVAAVNPNAARREGENIRNFGENLDRSLTSYFNKRDKMDRDLFKKEIRVQAEAQYQQAFFKARQDKRLADDGSNLMQLFGEHSSEFNDTVNSISDPSRKRIAQTESLGVANSFTKTAFAEMMKYDALNKQRRVEDYSDQLTGSIMSQEGDVDVQGFKDDFSAYVEDLNLDPETRNKLLDNANNNFDLALINKYSVHGETDKAVAKILESKNYSAKERRDLINKVIDDKVKSENINYTRWNRENIVAKKELEDQRDTFETAVFEKLAGSKGIDDINAVESEVNQVIAANPSLGTKSLRSIVKSFKNTEGQEIRDELYYKYSARAFNGNRASSFIHELTEDVEAGRIDGKSASSLLTKFKESRKRVKSDPSFSVSKKAAERLLDSYITGENRFGMKFFKASELRSKAAIYENQAKFMRQGLGPEDAMRKALRKQGYEPVKVVPNIPIQDQEDPAKLQAIKKSILERKGVFDSKEQAEAAKATLKGIIDREKQEKQRDFIKELIDIDKIIKPDGESK